MNIAIFADLHGYLRLCFKLCKRWERETGERLDLILQVGDLGAFPDERWLDWPTRRHARRDPEELGFLTYFAHHNAEVETTLKSLQSNLVFVRGNHEAHKWLDQQEEATPTPLFPVDIYQRVSCLKSGIPWTFTDQGEQITILGIGRIGAHNDQAEQKPSHIQDYELARARQALAQPIDILLTHDAPRGLIYSESGLHIISEILERQPPCYHFFGHYHGDRCYEFSYLNHVTHGCKLAEPHFNMFDPQRTLLPASMGILRWSSRKQHSFEIVNAQWFNEYQQATWQTL
jgi:Icc-related predicted phosphoesterase